MISAKANEMRPIMVKKNHPCFELFDRQNLDETKFQTMTIFTFRSSNSVNPVLMNISGETANFLFVSY